MTKFFAVYRKEFSAKTYTTTKRKVLGSFHVPGVLMTVSMVFQLWLI